MMMRSPVRVMMLAMCLGLLPLCRVERADPELPNIILCMADDQGWGDMGYTGHPVIQTPNFNAMAAEVLRFELSSW